MNLVNLEDIRIFKRTEQLYLGIDTTYNRNTKQWETVKVINTYGWNWSFDSSLYFQCEVEMVAIIENNKKLSDGWHDYVIIKDGKAMPFNTDEEKLKVYNYLEQRYKKHFDYSGYNYGRWCEPDYNNNLRYTKGEKHNKFIKCK